MKNPVLDPQFANRLSRHLNALPPDVLKKGKKATHRIKSFLVEHGVSEEAQGWANQIKMSLRRHVNREFLYDVSGRVQHPDHPMEHNDLTFVAESENRPEWRFILEDAEKLPIVRTDVRLFFFRASDQESLDHFFKEVMRVFREHKRTEVGDRYIICGLDMSCWKYRVRTLTIRDRKANAADWEEVS